MIIKDAFFVYQLSYTTDVEWHNRLHSHPENEYELHYFLQGEGTFKTGQTVYNISRGSLFLTQPHEIHSIKSTNISRPLTYYAILIKTEDSDEEIKKLLDSDLKNSNYYKIGTNYRFFFEELKDHGLSNSRNLQRAANYQLLSFLYKLNESPYEVNLGENESIHIEKALMIMQNSVFQELTLGELAEKLNLTDSYFIRLFKKKMKTTPMKYYTKLKIEAASSMLVSSTELIYEISTKLRFYSEFHFSKVFKAHTGFSPRQYRKEYRELV
ncbi:AraC family transcriptional regulator [Thiospirochaeta perfilievii]|uniref:AraC family transcriptional regulator n=1 Tax=Thiospirochaeta perfilievii TaxID=252967 RepID=A0A5C1QA79_9SPIO|nr:AraC family transcriptional regulator [Thiospirochaeta perfilievii]QEN04387.1 AraC family transcriptional regulator [Thiospirochaeta perfilievii]